MAKFVSKSFLLLFLITLSRCQENLTEITPTEIEDSKPSSNFENLSPSEIEELHSSNLQSLDTKNLTGHYHIPFSYFNYDTQDWKLVNIMNVQEEDPKDKHMFKSNPQDVEKDMIVDFHPPKSPFKLTFIVYLGKGIDGAQDAELQVFAVFNNLTRKALKIVEATGEWTIYSIDIMENDLKTIEFNGKLNSEGNEIGLRSFVIEKLSDEATEEVPAEEAPELPSADENIPNPVPVNVEDSSIKPGNDENNEPQQIVPIPVDDGSAPQGLNLTTLAPQNEGNKNPETDQPVEVEEEIQNAETEKPAEDNVVVTSIPEEQQPDSPVEDENAKPEVTVKPEDVESIPDDLNLNPGEVITNITEVEQGINNPTTLSPTEMEDGNNVLPPVNNTNDNSDYVNPIKESVSGSRGVINFFIVVIIAATLVIMFIFWRRNKRKREDEIPVFHHRHLSEHGNAAYTDDDTELDNSVTPGNNYNSFR